MQNNRYYLFIIWLLLAWMAPVQAQQKQKFSVVSFGLDAFAGTAQSEQYKKRDGDGALMAIIKTPTPPPPPSACEPSWPRVGLCVSF